MIKKYSLMILQTAINQTLALDESRLEKIRELKDKIIEIIISPLNVHFFISFSEKEILLLANCNEKPDSIIHSSPLGLIRLSILPSSKVRSLFNDKIRLSGDVELGQHVKQLFDEMDIDWEGHIARFTGDVVAHQIGNFVRQGLTFKQRINTSMNQNVTEYLQEELRVFPSREEVNDFFNDIDEMTLKSERLAAHVNQLLVIHESH